MRWTVALLALACGTSAWADLLEDVAGASAAWASWKISSSTTNARKVIAVGGVNDGLENTFTHAELADGTVDTWVGAGTAYVTEEYDQSGNAVTLTPVSSTKRPLHDTNGGTPHMVFDGTDDVLTNASLNLSTHSSMTVVFAAVLNETATKALVSHGTSSSARWDIVVNNGGDGYLGTAWETSTFQNTAVPFTQPRPVVVSVVFTSGSVVPTIRVNGGNMEVRTDVGSTAWGSARMADRPVYVGARSSSLETSMDFYACLVYPSALSNTDLRTIESNFCTQMGITIVPTTWAQGGAITSGWNDTYTPVDRTTHYETSPFATWSVDTDSTVMEVQMYTDASTTFDSSAELGVYVDGDWYVQLVAPEADGAGTGHIFLPSGTKRVTIENGLTTEPVSTVLGTWLTSAKGNGTTWTVPTITPVNRLVIYGDSITAGWNATTSDGIMSRDAYVKIVRDGYNGYSVAAEAWGFRALEDDADTAPKVTSFVDKLGGYSPSAIWFSIGTNDLSSDADLWDNWYADTLDEINTDMPGVPVYCMSPLIRTDDDTTNGFGQDVDYFRSALETVCSTRSWATYVDGKPVIDLADLDDSVHPGKAGMAKVGAKILEVLLAGGAASATSADAGSVTVGP